MMTEQTLAATIKQTNSGVGNLNEETPRKWEKTQDNKDTHDEDTSTERRVVDGLPVESPTKTSNEEEHADETERIFATKNAT